MVDSPIFGSISCYLGFVLGAGGTANPFSGLDDKFVVWIERVRLVEI